MDTAILPLAITMMAGPQILSDIIFATNKKPVQATLFFTLGVLFGVTVGVILATELAGILNLSTDTGEPSQTAQIIQYALVGLLIIASLRTYKHRERIQPPKWLGKLQAAKPAQAFIVAAMLVLLFPSDIMVLLTTGVHLESHGHDVTAAIPFILATTLIAALPLLALLIFRKQAQKAVPAFREWMNENIWLVNIIVYVIFIFLIIG